MKQTAAVIISVTALVVAVFGATPAGHAAASMILPKNSVGATQLKAGAVTGAKVRNGTLTAADFAGGQLPAGAQGPKGEPGPQGPRGADGPTGAPGLSGIEVVTASQQVQAGLTGVAYAACPGEKKVVAGGFTIDLGYLRIDQSRPATASIWRVQATNSGVAVGAVTAYAVCATVA